MRARKHRARFPTAPLRGRRTRLLRAPGYLYIKSVRLSPSARAMDYRDPVRVIDETIENLVYLVDWWLEDIDAGALRSDLLATDAVKSIAALRATRALLPRLRIVRSNYESAPSLPDAIHVSVDRRLEEHIENERTQLRILMRQRRGRWPPTH